MEKEFVTYEQALSLKKLGFNEKCLASYSEKQKILGIGQVINETKFNVLAPLYQQAFKWFRDKHNLDLHIKLNWRQSDFISYILSVNYPKIYDIDFDTYKEAENFAIGVLITIAKEQNLETN
jgi:hypothetical protein